MFGATFNLENGANALSKMVLKKPFFCQKAQSFVYFGPYDFVQISLACGTNIFYGVYLWTKIVWSELCKILSFFF